MSVASRVRPAGYSAAAVKDLRAEGRTKRAPGWALASLLAVLLAGCAHDSVATAPGARTGLRTHAAHRAEQPRLRSPAKPVVAKAVVAKPVVAKPVVAKPVAATSDTAVTGTVAPAAQPLVAKSSPRGAIPLPDKALLEREAAPDCTLKTEPVGASPADVRLRALDYERRCYQQVEGLVRDKLGRLQDAVEVTIEALDARDGASAKGR